MCVSLLLWYTHSFVLKLCINAQFFDAFPLSQMQVQVNMKVTQIATLNIKEIHEVESVKVSEGPDKNFNVDFFFFFCYYCYYGCY